MERREFIRAAGLAAFTAALPETPAGAEAPAAAQGEGYGLIGWMDSSPGQRDALAAILAEGMGAMPGCRLYHIAADAAAPDRLWITESWDNRQAHAASLNLPAVREAIRRGRPLIAGMERVAETKPIGGVAKI